MFFVPQYVYFGEQVGGGQKEDIGVGNVQNSEPELKKLEKKRKQNETNAMTVAISPPPMFVVAVIAALYDLQQQMWSRWWW